MMSFRQSENICALGLRLALGLGLEFGLWLELGLGLGLELEFAEIYFRLNVFSSKLSRANFSATFS